MFRMMRRENQQLSLAECIDILSGATSGVLALHGDDGYPYAVPLSYVYSDNKIYFHGAVTGHKIDAIKNCPKASFCVVAQDDVIPEKYTTAYRSVIAFGTIRFLQGAEYTDAAVKLADKYLPLTDKTPHLKEIESASNRMSVFELDIEHISGKEGMALRSQRA